MATPTGSDYGATVSESVDISRVDGNNVSNKRAYIAVAILFLVNLLNYIDRFTIAGVLDDIQIYYGLDKSQQGLLQTVFIISYMLLAPLFGYLGDRYSRKLLMCVGISFWSLTTLVGSFIPSGLFPLFLVVRGLVGVGEASYSTIAPTIISDLFTDQMRSRMLGAFYFAIPVGSGLGYIIGSTVAKAAGGWWWALRVTPGLGLLSVVLILIFLQDPPRGSAEGGTHIVATTWWVDMKSLVANLSFVWSTLGFTCVAFVAGALSFWAPQFMMYAVRLHSGDHTIDQTAVSFKFGIITCFAGIVGVGLGSYGSQKLRSRSVKADPLICALGMLLTAPFLYFSLLVSRSYPDLTLALVFFTEVFLCLNWPIVADMVLYVVIPPRRSSAEAFQILASHALGDAISPYIIGTVSDGVKNNRPEAGDSDWNNWDSLQDALYITTFVSLVGALCFIVTSWYIEDDKKVVDDVIKQAVAAPSTTTLRSDLDRWDANFVGSRNS